jgi:hypothetical protein
MGEQGVYVDDTRSCRAWSCAWATAAAVLGSTVRDGNDLLADHTNAVRDGRCSSAAALHPRSKFLWQSAC